MDEDYYIEQKKYMQELVRLYSSQLHEIEYKYKKSLYGDKDYMRIRALLSTITDKLEKLKEEYDDNRVYRTGERQLSTRYDCFTMRT